MKYILVVVLVVGLVVGGCTIQEINSIVSSDIQNVSANNISTATDDINAQFEGMMGAWKGLYDKDCDKESKDVVIQWNNAKCYRCKDLNKSIAPNVIAPGQWFCP